MAIGEILVIFLVLCAIGVLIWGAGRLLALLPLDEWWRNVVRVVFTVLLALLAIFWLIQCVRAGRLIAPVW